VDALTSVGVQQLSLEDLQLPDMAGLVRCFGVMHKSAEKAAVNYLQTTRRATYVTPTSYLELISSFKMVLKQTRQEVGQMRSRLQKGLDALGAAEYAVNNMEKELTVMKPQLAKTKEEVGKFMKVIEVDKEKAAVVMESCQKTEEEATRAKKEAGEISADAQKDLDEALPALEVAEKCLRALKLSHIQEVAALKKPPGGVKLALEAICIMFQVKPVRKNDPDTPGKKFDDYWEPSQTVVLKDAKKLLEDLFQFDKDNIPEPVINKMEAYVKDTENFTPEQIKKASVACEAMCIWCHAMYKYHFVAKAVEPKRRKLAIAEGDLKAANTKLAKAQAELKAVQDKLAKLEEEMAESVAKEKKLTYDMDMCVVKLENAGKLINGLGGEKERWTQTVADLTAKWDLLVGNAYIAAGMLSYSGPYDTPVRGGFDDTWHEALDTEKIRNSEGSTLRTVLGNEVLIQNWQVRYLPGDNLSVENGIIIDKARRWSLMIDPQRQANKFIKTHGKLANEAGIDSCKLSDTNFLRTLEMGIQFGKWILLENIREELDAALEPILLQQKVKDGSSFTIKLGDKVITYMDTFRFFMTTTLPNPHYSPEISVKVTLLNFAITQEGLEDQMLGLVVSKEQPEMEEKKQALTKDSAEMAKVKKDLEDEILRLLSADGDILESKELIATLEVSKKTSEEINKKMAEGKVTSAEIDRVRKFYVPYAVRTAILYFGVTELSVTDPMYQFSLQWYQALATLGIENAPSAQEMEVRIQNLLTYFTYNLYSAVCRGLFEAHKPLFSFSLALKIYHAEIDQTELRLLLTGPLSEVEGPEPPREWINPQMWNEIQTVSQLPHFAGLDDAFADMSLDWDKLYHDQNAHEAVFPGKWQDHLNMFQRILLLRTFRMDKVSNAVEAFVINKLGKEFVMPPTFDISISYADSTKVSPLIFILVSGADPVADMLAFAAEMGMGEKLEAISLGQGQGPKAKRLIEQARMNGGWVLLCNCHLSVSWLPELEQICEQINPAETHNDYRLWLTSMPTAAFPALLLQNGVKMTNEPPKGVRANLMGSYSKFDDRVLEECKKPEIYKKLVFAFCFFHAICQDRRKFGPIGWNIPYGFTFEDLVTCRRQLCAFVDDYDFVPIKVLCFMGAAINYGGRVTDDKDKRLIQSIIKRYVAIDLVEQGEGYKFSESGIFYCPNAESSEEFQEYIKTLPLQTAPEAFGLDQNCAITCSITDSKTILDNILNMAPSGGGGGGGGKSASDVMDEIAESLMEQTPPLFDLDELDQLFPTAYEESSNTVFKQESFKYNRLISSMKGTLPTFRKALKGLVAMSEDLDAMGTALFGNQVPPNFTKVSYLNEMPLSGWIKDLNKRIETFNHWKEVKKPYVFWISGFFFPQAFLTAQLQNTARSQKIAIDRLSYMQEIDSKAETDGSNYDSHPKAGCRVWGLFIEGCRWSCEDESLMPSFPKVLFGTLPPIIMTPVAEREEPQNVYKCPLYKVLSRKGTLSTTGHSTNFVMYVEVPTNRNQDIWTIAGVALFLALR
jgi:dynein heavy chain